MRYKYIAFDADGTLIDTLSAAADAYLVLLRQWTGREYPRDLVLRSMGLTNEDTFPLLGLEYSEEFIRRWMVMQKEAYRHVTLFDGVKETLLELNRRGHVMGIVTSRNQEEYEVNRSLFSELEPYLHCVVLAEMTEQHKPDPQPMLKFMELCGAAPEQTMYVGDTKFDMQCAASAGAAGCVALWGASDPEIDAPFRAAAPSDLIELTS